MDQQELVITMEEKPDYLYVYTSGIRTREAVKSITAQVFQTACDKRLSKILIDVRDLIGIFGIVDIYYFVTELLKGLSGKGVDQLAVIDIRRSPNPGWFLEPIAQSRGYNIRVFAEERSAIRWLNG